MRKMLVAAAAALLATVSLAGCDNSSTPVPTPTPTPEVSSSFGIEPSATTSPIEE